MVIALLSFLSGWGWAQEERELLLGLVPEENIFRLMKKHLPLAEYLSEELGLPVRFTILARYGDVVEKFQERGLDGAFFESFTAVWAHERLGVEPLVKPVGPRGSSTVEYIFVRKDSGIRALPELRGKRAAFVSRATTSFAFVLSSLRRLGVRSPEGFFSEYYWTGSHDAAIYAVLDRWADVGAAKEKIFHKVSREDPLVQEELLVLARSARLPDMALCVRKDLPLDLRERLREVLLRMNTLEEGRRVLKGLGYVKFSPIGLQEFIPVYDLLGRAGINLRGFRYE